MTSSALARIAAATGVALTSATLSACGSHASRAASTVTSAGGSAGAPTSTSHSASRTTKRPGVNPNQRETLPPGDIPDQVAYVPYTDRGLGVRISTPEGWSRVARAGRLTFTDKLNRVDVFRAAASGQPTVASVRRSELPTIRRHVGTFRLRTISTVTRSAGRAVRTAYFGDSAPSPVTGKVGTLAYERYDFAHAGREYVVLVSSPRGSDNVDPWRIITNSLRFTA